MISLNIFVLYSREEEKRKIEQELGDNKQINVDFIYIENEYTDFSFLDLLEEKISRIDSRYVCIAKSNYKFTKEKISKIAELLDFDKNKQKLFFITPYRLNDRGKRVDFLFSNKQVLNGKDNFINLNVSSYLIPTSFFKTYKFTKFIDWDYFLIYSLIRSFRTYYRLDCDVEVDDYPEWDFYNYERIYYKNWYQGIKDNYLHLLANNKDSKFLHIFITYLIELRFAANRNNRNKNVINDKEFLVFLKDVKEIYKKIPINVLIKHNINGARILPKYMCWNNVKIKYSDQNLKPNIITNPSNLVGFYKDYFVEKGDNISAEVLSINYDANKKELLIDFELVNGYCLNSKDVNIYVEIGKGKKITAKETFIYSKDRYFGFVCKEGLLYQLVIPEKNFQKGFSKALIFCYQNFKQKLKLNFIKTASRLSSVSSSYWAFGNYLLSYDKKNDLLTIENYSTFKNFIREFKFISKILFEKDEKAKYTLIQHLYITGQAVSLRMLYWISRPFFKNKNIWITFDQLFKGGDNGQYIFSYIRGLKNNNGVDVYYIINKDAQDSVNLKKKYSGVLAFRSLRAKLLSMNAKIVLATRVDVKQYLGFTNLIDPYIRNLLNYDVVCLQHGLSIQEIAEYQNRLFDNTKFYLCASKFEIQNLLQKEYGYSEENLKLVGLARYDGLIKNDQKFILISPTWRRNVTAGTNRKGERHIYSENFKHTTYFKIYNELINDERLIKAAKVLGYKIVYLVHPILTPQLDDFTKNDYVEILGGANNEINYEKILSQASLMVTDHSGIMYDFAYMRKPIIYYHPDSLPPQYMAKTMNYEQNGFGPVCRNNEQVVDEIIKSMTNKCQISPEYSSRANDFFAFSDHNSCERIFKAVQNYQEVMHK